MIIKHINVDEVESFLEELDSSTSYNYFGFRIATSHDLEIMNRGYKKVAKTPIGLPMG